MKYRHIYLSLLSLFIVVQLYSQSENWLPEGKTLASNGTFVSVMTDFPGTCYSENGVYHSTYEVGNVGDEYREIKNFRLYNGQELLYAKAIIPGSDFMISNSGKLAVFDHSFHFNQKVGIKWYDAAGDEIKSGTYHSASFFLFSPTGDEFVLCSSGIATVLNLNDLTVREYAEASQAAWSEDGKTFAVADEKGNIYVYGHAWGTNDYETGTEFLRKIAVGSPVNYLAAIDKKNLYIFNPGDPDPVFIQKLGDDLSYRDLEISGDKILAGVHYKNNGISRGILEVYDLKGNVVTSEIISESNYKTFDAPVTTEKTSGKAYDPISWPFEPFNEVHTVWNHYEQHMGDGSTTWSYLHQGLDINVDIGEPAYAVQAGYVKCVLSIGGDYYWRVGISPEQVSGYSDGWLYAHLIQSTIQVAVGDYVNVHDLIGNIIDWGPDWGHIHFVQIRDHGTVWQYDDDEWGINFNPLLALDPITDPVAPVIENSASGKKFEFCTNETSTYLEAQNLHGNIDIIVKVSDYYADSPWEQPAFTTWYTVKRLPENYVVFPKTMGQILNHTYSFYGSSFYEEWAPLYYKRDYQHPTPSWSWEDRDYWHILTNNNGDSIAELSEKQLSFPTQDYNDGDYRIVVEVYDEYGNSDIDSMDVKFINGNTTGINNSTGGNNSWIISPNPVNESSCLIAGNGNKISGITSLKLYDNQMKMVRIIKPNNLKNETMLRLETGDLEPGIYFLLIASHKGTDMVKVVVL